jgi:lipid-binding SYLF domain-containing protein
MPSTRRLTVLLACAALIGGCATTGTTPDERRQAMQDMRQTVLTDLYRLRPDARSQIRDATGYAVLSNANINVVLASFGGGFGIVRDNATGKDTYMRMGEVGVGFGMGVKDFRAVFVFHDRATLDRFIDVGWEFGAHADAAARAGEMGGAVGGEILVNNITIYQITEAGLALQATVKGTRYWRDRALN